jgi:hypothetical protein
VNILIAHIFGTAEGNIVVSAYEMFVSTSFINGKNGFVKKRTFLKIEISTLFLHILIP